MTTVGGKADELLRELLSAGSPNRIDRLLDNNLSTALVAFPGWTSAPKRIRDDPGALRDYGNTLVYVAQRLNTMGHPGPLRSLIGDQGSNPMSRWQEAFARQETLAAAGRVTESIRELRALLAELESSAGTAVADVLPKVLGALGLRLYQAGELAEATGWTRRALEACHLAGDTAGVEIYRENLQSFEARYLPTVAPEAGARLLRCRELVASAQAASDRFDYATSNEVLERALALVAEDEERLRPGYAGKIYGLRGWNHYHLGDPAAARVDTGRALAECQAADDPAGIRVYTANLEFLREGK